MKALEGVRILDMTHVQSGPTCTQLLAWFGADVIKIERPGIGDITRGQLRDKPGVDSLYFTMLNGNKRSITLDTKNAKGRELFAKLIQACDVMVENFSPGAIDRMGFPWEKIQELNPRMIYASVKGFGPGPYEVLNLCRVKLRDQQRLAHGPLKEYPQYPHGTFGDATPRSGNASGGGQPGWILKCKGWESDPNAYIYFITQAAVWPAICRVIGKEAWIEDPAYATADARLDKLAHIFDTIEEWTKTKTKQEAMDILNPLDVPCGPILSMKEIAEEPSLRATGTVVEVDHPTRGKYLTVGNPIKLSDSPADVRRSPLLGEHSDEILSDVLGLSAEEAEAYKATGALGQPPAAAAE
jgi:crotonobetainyl-CoA:carnitine CoA-transferase CaiB-like acyl-CoA transferase